MKTAIKIKRRQILPSVRFLLIFGLLYLTLLPLAIFAKTLAEYSKNIETLKVDINALLDDDWETTAEKRTFEREFLTKLPRLIPAHEKIEWQGNTIETDNQWLADKIAEYEKEPQNSPGQTRILTEVYERLDAVKQKVEQLENPAASNRTKDEDKQKLAEILRREEYQKPEVKKESLFREFYRKIMEWLAKMLPKPDFPNSSEEGARSFPFVLQIILYALVLGLTGFLVYRFAPFFINRLRNREKRENKERVILGERLLADETSQTIFDEAEKLAREGNLRGAIRKGYIALLCELNDRKIIGLANHKTNRDYLRDVRKQHNLYENMNGLTSNFERHWYGFDKVDETDWEKFRQGYKKTLN